MHHDAAAEVLAISGTSRVSAPKCGGKVVVSQQEHDIHFTILLYYSQIIKKLG
jgi:hypothetical protein